MKYFDLEFESQKAPADLLRETLQVWTGQLGSNGYKLVSQTDVTLTYSRTYRPWPAILFAVILFPIGLLFLLITEEAAITAAVEDDEDTGGSALIVNGKGPKSVRRAFEAMEV